jgi:2-succinyl-5-enolpyruvyl-6-hydroxy-3-cyclohexene-1-carboxylate synthase
MTATGLARAVVQRLLDAGVTEVVVAPGSRNAPLSFAAFSAAEAGLVRLHTRLDERSAGVLALGLSKQGNRAAVLCTSGTAVANLHPAVLEAVHAEVPLVVVSADRPVRLRGTGANQVTDQVGVFGGLVVTHDVVEALPEDTLATRGPVHLNVQLDDPLLPPASDAGWQPASGSGATDASRVREERPAAVELPLGPRTVVVAGDPAARDRPHAASPRRRAGRCSPNPPAGRAPVSWRCAATGCCSAAPWEPRSSGSSSSADRPSRGP